MSFHSITSIEGMVADYIEYRDKLLYLGRKKLDAEKEYNRLLTKYQGENKNYSLEQAEKIYACYLEMQTHAAESVNADEAFRAAEEKLREIGDVLFEASISANIMIASADGRSPAQLRPVTVMFDNGEVRIVA